jgi:hypothetical protein
MDPITLGVAAVALSAAGAYTSFQGARNQAKMGQQSARLRQEQAGTEMELVALQAREQEAERLRRAEVRRSAAMASTVGAGFDWWSSGSAQALDEENERIVQGDISSIRLLGAARQRRYALEGRSASMVGESYSVMGANAWVQPTVGLLGSALGAARGMGGAGGGGADVSNAGPSGMSYGDEYRAGMRPL